MISTPESGVDSIAITFSLLDPIITVARPVVAFFTAVAAGIFENLLGFRKKDFLPSPDLTCPVDGCCDGIDCAPEEHQRHHTFTDKVSSGLRYALTDLWGDMAGWFLMGLLLAGLISAIIPEEMIVRHLGGGIESMVIMLAVGIPLYICATASTPIAAAMILKGVSPGTALVFLLVGPATNVTSLTVLFGVLGKRASTIYLATIALSAVLFGLALDQVYDILGVSAQAVVGEASEIIPFWAQLAGALLLLSLSVKPVCQGIAARFGSIRAGYNKVPNEAESPDEIPKAISCTSPN